ncbi:MAG: hypothetical protein ACREFY_00460 [Acetobacteraceae bacterium]
MASEPEAVADAAARLEAALERIARLAQAAPDGRPAGLRMRPDASEELSRAALASRLDRIIERLRGALDHGA